MTPAVLAAKRAKIAYRVHEYAHDPAAESYGEEAAIKLGIDPDRVFKTLVVETGNEDLSVAVIPVSARLDLKAMAEVLGVKKLAMARPASVERTTG